MARRSSLVATLAPALALAALLMVGPASRAAPADREGALASAVRAYTAPGTKFAYAFTELDADRIADAVVLVTDRAYCDGGGCPLLVLRGTADGFVVVSKSMLANQPVRVSTEARHGWRTLLVWVKGGTAPHFAVLPFGGSRYPANASRQPAASAGQVSSSRTLIFALAPS